MNAPVPADTLSRLKSLVGEGGWSTDPERLAPKLIEWRDRWSGTTPLLLLPRSTVEVAQIVGLCAEAGVAHHAPGRQHRPGRRPDSARRGAAVAGKMRAVRDIDVFDDVIVVEAGLTLAEVHEAPARGACFR